LQIAINTLSFASTLLDIIGAYCALLSANSLESVLRSFGSIAEEMEHAPIETLYMMFNELFHQVKVTDTVQRKARERMARLEEEREQQAQGDQEGREEQQRPTEQVMAIRDLLQRAGVSPPQQKLRKLSASLERSRITGNLSATAISIGIVSCPLSLLLLAQDTQPAVVWITAYIIVGTIITGILFRWVWALFV